MVEPVVEGSRHWDWVGMEAPRLSKNGTPPDLPLASASSDIIRWSRALLSHTLDAARSY